VLTVLDQLRPRSAMNDGGLPADAGRRQLSIRSLVKSWALRPSTTEQATSSAPSSWAFA
jgi:hypothetical protein